MQPNSSAHAADASASSTANTTKGVSGKAGTPHQQTNPPTYQVKGGSAAAATSSLITQGGGFGQQTLQPTNALLEPKLGINEIFRPLGAPPGGYTLGDALSGTASSTSPSPGALFADPLFKGLPQLPDGSPEDPAVLSSSAKLGGVSLGQPPSSASLGGGPGLLFGPLGGQPGVALLEDRGISEKSAPPLRAGQISTGFLPLGGSSGKLGGPPPLLGFGAGALGEAVQPQAGDSITGTYATYHGPIDLMVPRLAQDFDKSLDTLSDLNVSKAKKFRSQAEPQNTVLVFLAQNARNLSFVINQEDLCDNVLSVSVMEQLGFKKDSAGGVDMGVIHDFTLVDFQYLIVLMNQGRFVVFDCSMVLEGSARQLRFVNQDKVRPIEASEETSTSQPANGAKSDQQFIRIEVMEIQNDFNGSGASGTTVFGQGPSGSSGQDSSSGSEPRRVLVFGKQAHRMLCLEFPRSDSPDMDMMEHPEQAELQIPSNLENRPILDIAVMEGAKQVAILFGDNMLTVFDLATRTAVFRTRYSDATDNITQLFYMAPRHLETPNGAPLIQGSQPNNDTTLLSFFLLVETKLVQKDTTKVKKKGESQVSISRTKHLRKLHLVQVQQQLVLTRSKVEKRDRIEQIDALTFGEETPKLVEFVKCANRYGVPNYFAFLLARERVKSNGALKLITVKIRWAPSEEQTKTDDASFEQDEESKAAQSKQQSRDDGSGSFSSKWKLKFDFVTSLGPRIENFRSEKQKPNYLNVIEAVESQQDEYGDQDVAEGEDPSSEEPVAFYIYTGVGNQSVVFKRTYGDISQQHGDEANQRQLIDEARAQIGKNAVSKKGKKKTQSNYDEMLERMNHEQQRDKEQQLKAQATRLQTHSSKPQVDSSDLDQGQDPAILSQSQPGAKCQQSQNPEQQPGQDIYKKKTAGATDSKKERPSSAKKTRPGSAKKTPQASQIAQTAQQPTQQQQQQQPMYKTKGKQSSPPPESNTDAATVSEAQPSAKSQKQSGKGAATASKDASQQPTQQQQTPPATQVSVPPTKKQQQDQIIENYQELTKKFSELHMKMNSLQQQVKAQKDLQIQVEQTIAKAIKTSLPEIVKKQVEETVQPLMQKQQELLDLQVRQTLIPKIEALAKLAPMSQTSGVALLSSSDPAIQVSSPVSDSTIRKVIQYEFKQAMTKEIIPGLEHELKSMLSKVKDPIANVNKIFYEKLVNEEQKSDHMVQVFEQRLHMAQQQAQQQQQHQQPHYQAAFVPSQMQQPGFHQSFSLQPQASQTSLQPIAFYHQQPPQQFQVQMPPQPINQQQLFNVSVDTSMANNTQQQPPQQQQAQIIPLQPQQTGTFHPQQPQPQTSFNLNQQQTQQPHFVQQPPQQIQQVGSTPQSNTMIPQVMQIQAQQPTQQSQQLQPTNTNFVPTAQPQQQVQQPGGGPATSGQFMPNNLPLMHQTSTASIGGGVLGQATPQQAQQPQQQNVSAPTFTPQATVFQPSNAAQMLRPVGMSTATVPYGAKPMVPQQVAATAFKQVVETAGPSASEQKAAPAETAAEAPSTAAQAEPASPAKEAEVQEEAKASSSPAAASAEGQQEGLEAEAQKAAAQPDTNPAIEGENTTK